ncbi:MAG: hypothetical protein LBI79_08240 [Nitrososphaerota archaeon]|nr:hypothetical protein [Nitrososphaerota archaeon]
MKFKSELILLVIAITLFAVATVCYSHSNNTPTDIATLNLTSTHPYRSIAVVFVGIGAISMVTASISYSKKTKDLPPIAPDTPCEFLSPNPTKPKTQTSTQKIAPKTTTSSPSL